MIWNPIESGPAVAPVVSAVGFKKFIYFISIGYGFSIAACAFPYMAEVAPAASMLRAIRE